MFFCQHFARELLHSYLKCSPNHPTAPDSSRKFCESIQSDSSSNFVGNASTYFQKAASEKKNVLIEIQVCLATADKKEEDAAMPKCASGENSEKERSQGTASSHPV